jgi:Spy/CpxP family protein refolding chaperone
MKKSGILMLVIMMISFAGMAQNRGGGQQRSPEERAKSETATIKEKCGLDTAQEKKVYDLILANGKKTAKMREEMMSGGGPSGDMREKTTKMREEQNAEIKKILTAEQYKKYEKYLEERRAQRQGGGGPR